MLDRKILHRSDAALSKIDKIYKELVKLQNKEE